MMPCCKPLVLALCLLVQVSLAARPNVLMIAQIKQGLSLLWLPKTRALPAPAKKEYDFNLDTHTWIEKATGRVLAPTP